MPAEGAAHGRYLRMWLVGMRRLLVSVAVVAWVVNVSLGTLVVQMYW